ncbi:deazaflavin-dependent oxidoreductase (nitroreductase family) [Kribbella voronezhensis]|uniref:Deazaflavin-dependent oxidoreductase (Nitroreductase family) n=1 Tax=Kribbella voronezhensis TaxID=2512212 RepID=A0A4R7SVQ7_9ACTN|nr:nitroreductase family deazaflavin-dependent oxidoreductase [Kribbella voronezhensis]TDU83264.1 deazaflavin-dependent oxidoreductase (nitroreductase family) [Kribbella voronezhensis]
MTRQMPRWLARSPIPLYRWGFGRLFGSRLMMLEHRGRTTGQRRYVVLEVVDREPESLIIVSGYGPSSQWYRNILATPDVRIWTGATKDVLARATPVPSSETPSLLESYRGRHRRAAKALGRTLDIPELIEDGPLPEDIATRLPLVRIDFGNELKS